MGNRHMLYPCPPEGLSTRRHLRILEEQFRNALRQVELGGDGERPMGFIVGYCHAYHTLTGIDTLFECWDHHKKHLEERKAI